MKTTKQTPLTEETAWPLIVAAVTYERALEPSRWRHLVEVGTAKRMSRKRAEDWAKATSVLHGFAHMAAAYATTQKEMFQAFSQVLKGKPLKYVPTNPRSLARKCREIVGFELPKEGIKLPRTGNKNAAKPHKGHARPNRKRSPVPTDSGAGNLTD